MAGEPTMVPKATGPSLDDARTGRLKKISVLWCDEQKSRRVPYYAMWKSK